jgi:nucleoside-diphosphate-sugar epimerase
MSSQSADRRLLGQALVTGAGGFIGGHLVKELVTMGVPVRAVDIKPKDQWYQVLPEADNRIADLRQADACSAATERIDTVFNLAADMGGMGFIHSAECEIMRNSALININMVHAAAGAGVGRYFFSSSVCVYRDMAPGEPALTEDDAVPANPDNEYGWEKLYAERTAAAYGRRYGFPVRIARFQNCFGPEGTWRGGREKAPAALCRKVAEADDGGVVEVWGDGTAVRSYVYVDDLVAGIDTLMRSDLEGPANIGTSEYVTVDELVRMVIAASGKDLDIKYVDGPVGVQSRNFSHARIEGLGWAPDVGLAEGIRTTYGWIADQVREASAKDAAPA